MANYDLRIKPSAVKELEDLQAKDRRRIVSKIQNLAEEPRPRGCEKLSGRDRFRLRQGDFRILFEVDDGAETVTVVKIGHRRDVYRQS
ncbi:MAG: type II toxin-antitoxin system RelE/ParE family toxin [Gemmatimonadetes bacterium]|nr:type II toxin-antitoxin system RelE/ParE family toxin [Gemmatimonadota bacterium]